MLENRDLTAAAVDNQGAYQQAQANYGIATASTLPEDWQKAEYDLKTAKEAYDAQQKVYDSRQLLYKEGAMPRKDLDAAAVALVQAKSQYELAQQHLAALQKSGKKDQLEAAKGQLTSAQGKYENAAAQLSYTEIRSPIDGVVTDRPSYPGETPAPGAPLITVMDTSSVIAKAHIPQEQAAALKVGDAATILAPGDIKATGKVALVSPALDPNSTTVEVWIDAPNPDGSLRPGTSVQVEAVAQTVKDAVVVPDLCCSQNTRWRKHSDDRARRCGASGGGGNRHSAGAADPDHQRTGWRRDGDHLRSLRASRQYQGEDRGSGCAKQTRRGSGRRQQGQGLSRA